MQILRASDHRRMPWRNGGGETAEIVSIPEGAGLDAFRWRASMATVAQAGPFSLFPGVDRTLAVLEGEGLHLTVEGMAPVALRPGSPPFRFPADSPCTCRLLNGPVTDLNIMSRRGAADHSLRRLTLGDGESLDLRGTTLALLGAGTAMLGSTLLIAQDAVLVGSDALSLEALGEATVFLVEISA